MVLWWFAKVLFPWKFGGRVCNTCNLQANSVGGVTMSNIIIIIISLLKYFKPSISSCYQILVVRFQLLYSIQYHSRNQWDEVVLNQSVNPQKKFKCEAYEYFSLKKWKIGKWAVQLGNAGSIRNFSKIFLGRLLLLFYVIADCGYECMHIMCLLLCA